jgi:hypothetical protein
MEYTFGRKIARHCLGIQITVINADQENDLIVREITVQFGEGKQVYSLSSLDKEVLESLSERGQSTDPRNIILRVFRGAGNVATTVSTFAHVGPSFTPGVAAFVGPFIDAYTSVFPDYTVNQVVRLGNAAFEGNKVVPKSNAVKVVVFVPLKMLFDKSQRKTYRHDPAAFWQKIAVNPVIYGSVVKTVPAG